MEQARFAIFSKRTQWSTLEDTEIDGVPTGVLALMKNRLQLLSWFTNPYALMSFRIWEKNGKSFSPRCITHNSDKMPYFISK